MRRKEASKNIHLAGQRHHFQFSTKNNLPPIKFIRPSILFLLFLPSILLAIPLQKIEEGESKKQVK
jgi:hypothetical protein